MAPGALQQRTGAGRRIDYVVDKGWALWPALRALVIGLTPPSWFIRDALRTVDGIDTAFVYGSTARGTANADRDVDVFVFGNEVDTRALHRGLLSVAMLTGRPVNPGIFTYRKLAEGLGRPDSSTRRFLREVLAGPKTWVGGSVSALEPLAIASDAAFSPPVEYPPSSLERQGAAGHAATPPGTANRREPILPRSVSQTRQLASLHQTRGGSPAPMAPSFERLSASRPGSILHR